MYVHRIILKMLPLNFKCKDLNSIGHVLHGMLISDILKMVGNIGHLSAIIGIILKKPERQTYLKNAYRVLLTRARQGMVIVIPQGNPDDLTRKDGFYDPTFEYLRSIGFKVI